MSKRLSLAEVDRLIDTLDRSRSERGPRAEIETLYGAYARARRAEELMRVVYGCAFMGLIIALVVRAYATGSIEFPVWYNLMLLAVVLVYLLATTALVFRFPVLRRRERVVHLLEHFHVDLAQVDSWYARKNMPAAVLAAVETLERAQIPTDLGADYAIVERWSAKVHGLNFDGLYSLFLWCLLVVIAISGGQFGIPDFLRGAAAGIAAMMAYRRSEEHQEQGSSRRRAENALGRWRHLVPAMRELPQ